MKILFTIFAILYALSPYDLLPDFAFGWGWLDDLVLLFLLWRFFYSTKRTVFQNRMNRQFHQYFRGNTQTGKTGANSGAQFRKTHAANAPYQILGIEPTASDEEIKQAYRTLANKYHPDKVEHLGDEFKKLAEERFKEIEEAYRILTKN